MEPKQASLISKLLHSSRLLGIQEEIAAAGLNKLVITQYTFLVQISQE